MKTLLITVAALVAAVPSAPLLAEQPGRAVVSTAGLDLATEAGVRALDLRILHAASAACGIPSSADAQGRAKRNECRDQVTASVAPQRDAAIALARGASADRLAAR